MNHSTRAPLIVYVPQLKGGKASGVVEFVDIYPTLCDLCNIQAPKGQLQGVSLAPILKNHAKKVKEYAFIQWQGGYDIVSEKYNAAIWLKNDSVVARMIFDREKDAGENKNRADDVSLADELKEMECWIKNKIEISK